MDTPYLIAFCVLAGIGGLPLAPFSVIACVLLRRRGDPVRKGVPFIAAAMLFLLLYIATEIIALVCVKIGLDREEFLTTGGLLNVGNYTGFTSVFLAQVADMLALVAMTEMGLGYLALQRAVRKSDGRRLSPWVVRGTAVGLVLVLFALAAALFGVTSRATADFNRATADPDLSYAKYSTFADQILRTFHTADQVETAYDILALITSLGVVALAGTAVLKSRGMPQGGSTVLFLCATIIFSARYIWHIIYDTLWLLPIDGSGLPQYFHILDALLDEWPFVVVLVLLYTLAARRIGGLWTPAPQQQQQPLPQQGVTVAEKHAELQSALPGQNGQYPPYQPYQQFQYQQAPQYYYHEAPGVPVLRPELAGGVAPVPVNTQGQPGVAKD